MIVCSVRLREGIKNHNSYKINIVFNNLCLQEMKLKIKMIFWNLVGISESTDNLTNQDRIS